MIEMLGVLAIIGVLSIGGIALYRRAVNHHLANSILDDANRFAFVITEKGGFPANAFIDNVQYERTSTYNLDAFVGSAGGQFGIVVTDVPKGVCEPLIDKANIDYKVRVLPANTAESIQQLSASGLIYDSFNKDICTNDLNDIVLYFGDTSAQCNKPKEGEDYTPCNTNAECCGGSFCLHSINSNSDVAERGTCQKIGYTLTHRWERSDNDVWISTYEPMNWWSAKNWCEAQGLRTFSRADIGCEDQTGECETNALLGYWSPHGHHWLEERDDSYVYVASWRIAAAHKRQGAYAFCH